LNKSTFSSIIDRFLYARKVSTFLSRDEIFLRNFVFSSSPKPQEEIPSPGHDHQTALTMRINLRAKYEILPRNCARATFSMPRANPHEHCWKPTFDLA